MSILQNLIDSLILVIDGYHQMKTSKITIEQLKPIDSINRLSPEELNEKLSQLITQSIKEEPTRENFLRYLAFIITTTKPLVDKDAPLTEEEAVILRTHLTQLVVTTQHLCRLTPLQTYPIQYAHKTIHAYGLCSYFSSSQSTTGELIQKLFTAPGMGYTPEQFSADRVQSAITKIIREHQQLRVIQQELTTLKSEQAQLRQQLMNIDPREQPEPAPLNILPVMQHESFNADRETPPSPTTYKTPHGSTNSLFGLRAGLFNSPLNSPAFNRKNTSEGFTTAAPPNSTTSSPTPRKVGWMLGGDEASVD